MKWQTAWQLVRDVLITGAGLGLIVSQVWAAHPSDLLLVTGLALLVPAAAEHTRTVLTGSPPPRGGPPSSSSPSSSGSSSPSSPSPGATDEGGHDAG